MDLYTNMVEKTMKDKEKNKVREKIYLTQFVNANSGIFNHDIERNAELDIPLGTIEKILITNGSVAFFKDDNNILSVGVSNYLTNGKYGIGKNCIINTLSGDGVNSMVYEREIGKDCILMFNNYTHTPDLDIITTADMLTQIDISLNAITINTRSHPTPIVKNKSEVEQIKRILEDTKKGYTTASILSDNILSELLENPKDVIPVLNLSNVENSDNIQYLCIFYNDLLKRFYSKYGHAMNSINKMAQQSRQEVADLDLISFIEIIIKMNCRKKGYEQLNKLFGTDFNCELSETYKIEYERIKNDNETEVDGNVNIDGNENDNTNAE